MVLKTWIQSARLRTLPLALAVIIMGSTLALYYGKFSLQVFMLSLLTTVLLQILSNFANDYGDTQNGADNTLRTGPERAVQSGKITPKSMLMAILVTAMLSLVSGLYLLFVAFGSVNWLYVGFVGLGLGCIAAAIFYTAGKKPYGYAGLGDASVFLFFGMVGVCGSYYLHTLEVNFLTLLPAYACGALSVAVLNLNNMRDILPDTLAGKRTIPVRIGYEKAKLYQLSLIFTAFAALLIFLFIENRALQGCLLAIPIYFVSNRVWKPLMASSANQPIDHLLPQMALGTLITVAIFTAVLFISF